MEQIFQDRIPGARINFEGVSLPGLFGGCVRPLAIWSSAKEELGMNQDPTQSCLRQYENLASNYWTTADLVQAAVADVPICSEMLKTAFMQNSLSLGAAFVLPKDRHILVSLPPLQIAAGQFELPTEIDKGTQRKVRDILHLRGRSSRSSRASRQLCELLQHGPDSWWPYRSAACLWKRGLQYQGPGTAQKKCEGRSRSALGQRWHRCGSSELFSAMLARRSC
ncbi:unnamed protein product [Effrenium voratum]|uniref:Uncharacterized protein n=1 Tax=Effrenium voratum TaxID=2562239 RepID=A0AA36MR08_9DINO|nr:unnamed protein product [Effrenium voratum]CAJ1377014.1 unnamed protein product [Effrenium voratum]CAJ1390176.1 unnamed protein product [Effrenium voratum]